MSKKLQLLPFPLLLALLFSLGLFIVVLFAALVVAAAPAPQVLFTDNISATGATTAVTDMEQALVDLINNATTSIDVALYDFNRVRVRDALINAHNRGVSIRVATDDEAYDNSGYAPHFTALENAGITVIDDGRSSIMHNKFFVIDGTVVWSGSTNITDNGFALNHNNTLVFTSTQLADIYTTEFEEMFVDGKFGAAKSDNTAHSLSYNGIPIEIYFSPSDDALDEVIAEVNTATDSIYFSIFFATSDALRDALINRMQAGVEVYGVWDNLGAANQYSDDEALCLAGTAIKIEDFPGKMHNKYMVIDPEGANPKVITGSMNWSNSGDDSNDENTLIIHDGETAGAYLENFQSLYSSLSLDTLCTGSGSYIYLPMIINGSGQSTPVPPTPEPADVKIVSILYNPNGDDVAGEYIELENAGSTAQNMSGWSLKDESGKTFVFPIFSLQPGAGVKIWTKTGTNTTTDLFWGSGSAIWNNTGGDTAVLQDNFGQAVSSCMYIGGGTIATCGN